MSDFYPPRVRMRAMGLFTMASQCGDAIGPLLGAGHRGSVRLARRLRLHRPADACRCCSACARVPEPARGLHEAEQGLAQLPWRESVPRLWAVRSLRYQFIAGIWLAGAVFGARIVLPFFFRDEFGIGDFGLGVIGSIAGAAAVASTILGARIAQAQVNISPSAGVRLFSLLGFGIAGLVLLFALAPSVWVAVPLLILIGCGFGLVSPLMLSIQSMVSAPELRSTALALGQVVALAGIAFVGVIAAIASLAGDRWALAITSLLFLRGTFHVRTASRFIDADVDRPAAPTTSARGAVPTPAASRCCSRRGA